MGHQKHSQQQPKRSRGKRSIRATTIVLDVGHHVEVVVRSISPNDSQSVEQK